MSESTKYPLHIGVTESGYDEIGIIRSVSALSPLILEGIGSTMRISLTHNPQKEIKTCVRLLHDLGLYENYPTIITCPTCGRCMVQNTSKIADEILNYLIKNKNISLLLLWVALLMALVKEKAQILELPVAMAYSKFSLKARY